ncbi:MAG: TIGR02391 family protein [Terracidiphilus sp.]
MNLSSTISERLWIAVRGTYEAGNYSGAILDSIYLLSDVIRDKSGLESDGTQLASAAFSGANPIVKVNPLHTPSDQDEQKGVHFLLMGLYSGIRNPRSHGKQSDSAEVANAVIHFVDFLLGLIDKARSPFDSDQTINKVFDPLFGQSEKYADLVVAKVPARKLLDVLIQIFHRRTESPGRNVELFTASALKTLSADEQSSFWEVISESLEGASSDIEFRTVITIVQENWQKISEIARLRTEYRLLASIREGEYNPVKKICTKGVLGTWAVKFADKMDLRKEYRSAVAGRITSDLDHARAYAYQFHFDTYLKMQLDPPSWIVNHLKKLLRNNDQQTYNALWFVGDDVFASEHHEKWIAALKDAYAESSPTPEISDDDIPF